jgi:hypothetical protein
MSKYGSSETNIYSIFGASNWITENIKTIPYNFAGKDLGKEYIRISIVSGDDGINLLSARGQILIDIFIPAGVGSLRIKQIADILDTYLVGKTITSSQGNTQFGKSVLSNFTPDEDNAALYKALYSISFNHFNLT